MLIVQATPVHATGNVIHGGTWSLGEDTDGVIQQVSFTRSGENLVAAFQVRGSISSSYVYIIGIQFGLSVQNSTYYILLSPNQDMCVIWDAVAQHGTDIRCSVDGSMWTSWTPLSALGGVTDIWVWAAVGIGPLGMQGSANCVTLVGCMFPYGMPTFPLAYSVNSAYSNTNAYEIILPSQVTFTLNPSSISRNVTLVFDDTKYNFNSAGFLTVNIESGNHSVTITPTFIQASADTRYVFEGWSDEFQGSSRTLSIAQDISILVSYKRQFLLAVSSDYGNVTGDGWYDANATASFSVTPTHIAYEGFLGVLGVQHQFSNWNGDSVSKEPSSSIVMMGPENVHALWTEAYGPLFYELIGLIVTVPLAAGLLLYKKTRRYEP